MDEIIDLRHFVEQIVNIDAVAVEVSETGIQKGIILLTVHGVRESELPDKLQEITEVSVRGISTQIETSFADYGLNDFDGILIYTSDNIQSDEAGRSMNEGLDKLYNEFGYYAEERAGGEIKNIFDTYCEESDNNLLREISKYTDPVEVFYSPLRDTVVELYHIYGHPYYLYADGGVYESYRGSDYATEMLRDARYWNSTSEHISNSSVPA
jgi:hypothetical protein